MEYEDRGGRRLLTAEATRPGAWNKLVAVVHDDDHEAMLTHALIQSRRRDRT